MTIGEKISKLRKENNYTQEQLADILNVSRQSVSKWEANTAYPETDSVSRKKSILVITGWIALIGLRIFSYISATSTVIYSAIGLFPYMLMNLFVYVGISLLLTYTVCYSPNLKRSKK